MEGATLSQRMIDGLADAAATYSDLVVKVALDPRDSDHVSFIDAGLPAVSTIQGGDVSNGRIYTVSVTLDHINTDLGLRILLMNVDLSAQDLGNSDQHSVRLRRGCSDRVTQRQAAFIQKSGIVLGPLSCDGCAGQWLCLMPSEHMLFHLKPMRT